MVKTFIEKITIQGFLAVFIPFGFFTLVTLLFFRMVPQESTSLFNVMLGSWGTATLTIVNFHFGSSKGSERKDDMLAAAQEKNK